MGNEIKTYQQGKISFIVTLDKVVVQTSLGQQFYLLPKAHYFQRRLKLIRVMVDLEEIRDLNELATWCKPGISWVPTTKEYVNKLDNVLR